MHSTSINTGTWNYNVSHHGQYVAIASHPTLLVCMLSTMVSISNKIIYMQIGIDLVDCQSELASRTSRSAHEFVGMFTSQFTNGERDHILRYSNAIVPSTKCIMYIFNDRTQALYPQSIR